MSDATPLLPPLMPESLGPPTSTGQPIRAMPLDELKDYVASLEAKLADPSTHKRHRNHLDAALADARQELGRREASIPKPYLPRQYLPELDELARRDRTETQDPTETP